MKFPKIASLLLVVFCFSFFTSCSSDDNDVEPDTVAVDENSDLPEEVIEVVEPEPVIIEVVEEVVEPEIIEVVEEVEPVLDSSNLTERFVFDENIVIEHSYNTGGCDSPPCTTISESLVDVFVDAVPNDPYFYLSEDASELNLECQLDKGRRAEFKQVSEGPLTSFSKLELEGTYYDIPDDGVTIAQVHNRGGSSNKPFFRLVLSKDELQTVIRKDPEVSSSDTSFKKEEFSFINGADYDGSPLKVVVEKSNGLVHISVEQNNVLILDESYSADATTDWVNDTGIANGFYLKAGLYNDDGPHSKELVVGYTTVVFTSDDE